MARAEPIQEFMYTPVWREFAPPSHIEIEIISTCNRQCIYCPVAVLESHTRDLLPENLFHELIDSLVSMGFTGTIGTAVLCEPLLDRRCVELFSYARSRLPGSKIHLATNGDALTPKLITELLSRAFTTIRITEHDPVHKKADVIAAFLRQHPEYYPRVSILKYAWTENTLNWAGVYSDGRPNPSYAARCPFYEGSVVDAWGNVLLCCNDAFFARRENRQESRPLDNLANRPFEKIWKDSAATRASLFNGTHVDKFEICQKCTGTTTSLSSTSLRPSNKKGVRHSLRAGAEKVLGRLSRIGS